MENPENREIPSFDFEKAFKKAMEEVVENQDADTKLVEEKAVAEIDKQGLQGFFKGMNKKQHQCGIVLDYEKPEGHNNDDFF